MKIIKLTINSAQKYLSQLSLTLIFVLSVFTSFNVAAAYDATLIWSNRVELSTPVNGVVDKVLVKPGSIVMNADVLLQLDQRSFNAKLKYAEASYKSAKENSLETQRELVRQEDLYERAMLSEHDLQITKINNTTARALLAQSEAIQSEAKLDLEFSTIRAPFNAIVISINAVRGQVVTTDIKPPVLIVVAEADKMLARFYVQLKKISDIKLNQTASIEIEDASFRGIISHIGLEPETSRPGYYPVDVLFNYEKMILRAGQNAKVDLQ